MVITTENHAHVKYFMSGTNSRKPREKNYSKNAACEMYYKGTVTMTKHFAAAIIFPSVQVTN